MLKKSHSSGNETFFKKISKNNYYDIRSISCASLTCMAIHRCRIKGIFSCRKNALNLHSILVVGDYFIHKNPVYKGILQI